MGVVDKIKMSQLHEAALAEATGGRKTRGSGNQWRDQGDSRASHLDHSFAFVTDGKCTLGQSIAVSSAMLKKLIEQAGAERPLLGLRFYKNERNDIDQDWVAIRIDDFRELLQFAENPASVVTFTGIGAPGVVSEGELAAFGAQLEEALEEARKGGYQMKSVPVTDEVAELQEQLNSAHQVIAEQRHDILSLGERPTKEQHSEVMGQYARAESARRELEVQLGTLTAAVNAAEASDPIALMARIAQLETENRMKSDLIAQQHLQISQGNIQRTNLQETMSVPPKTLPWTVVFSDHTSAGPKVRAVHYDAAGVMTEVPVHGEVRVENTARGQIQIILNGTRIKSGAMVANGHVIAEVIHEDEAPLTLKVGEDV